jgi:holliday junction DNA helicase RuvA
MIGKIKGTLTELEGNMGLIETTCGISYQVYLTTEVLASCLYPCPIEVYTYFQVREDAHVLFGFKSKNEYNLFSELLSVSGVGPKTAFGIVSFSKSDELINAIKTNDVNYLTRTPGLGKKTAMKIILELSQKLKSEFKMDEMYMSEDDKVVIDALVSLGFKTAEAKQIFTKLPKELSIEEKIKAGLKLGTKGKK